MKTLTNKLLTRNIVFKIGLKIIFNYFGTIRLLNYSLLLFFLKIIQSSSWKKALIFSSIESRLITYETHTIIHKISSIYRIIYLQLEVLLVSWHIRQLNQAYHVNIDVIYILQRKNLIFVKYSATTNRIFRVIKKNKCLDSDR